MIVAVELDSFPLLSEPRLSYVDPNPAAGTTLAPAANRMPLETNLPSGLPILQREHRVAIDRTNLYTPIETGSKPQHKTCTTY